MRKLISIALAKYMGQTLTKEAALDIVAMVCDSLDRTVDVSQFLPVDYKGYRFQCELFCEILPELHKLHTRHYEEVEVEKAHMPLNPDYGRMLDIEKNGGLLQFTVREIESGELVGNMRLYLSISTHTQTPICSEDTFYVVPEHRGGFMAVRFWQYVERCCVTLGAREIQFDSKTVNNADAMARYLGYTPVAIKFLKVINHVQS